MSHHHRTEVLISVAEHAHDLSELRLTYQAPWLRHFTARFEQLE